MILSPHPERNGVPTMQVTLELSRDTELFKPAVLEGIVKHSLMEEPIDDDMSGMAAKLAAWRLTYPYEPLSFVIPVESPWLKESLEDFRDAPIDQTTRYRHDRMGLKYLAQKYLTELDDFKKEENKIGDKAQQMTSSIDEEYANLLNRES